MQLPHPIHRVCAGALLLLALGCSDESQRQEVAAPPPEGSRPDRSAAAGFDDLTIRFIMQGPGIVGTAPEDQCFSADGRYIYFTWNDPAKLDSLNRIAPDKAYDNYVRLADEKGWFELHVDTRAIRKLDDDEADRLVPSEWSWNAARTRRAEIRGSDVYLVDAASGDARRVTRTVAGERDVHMSPDGEHVYFRTGNNIYSVGWDGYPLEQHTDVRVEDEPDDEEPSAQRGFLEEQQKELFREFQKPEPEERENDVEPVYLGADWSIEDVMVSNSGRYVAYELSRDAEEAGAREPLVPHFITESGYMETVETRGKVGDKRDKYMICIVDTEGDSLVALDIDKELLTSLRSWSPTDDVLLVRSISDDYTYRYFYAIDPRRTNGGKIVPLLLDEYHDPAWVGGPNFYHTGGWMPDGSAIHFVSEEGGFSHLFAVQLNGTARKLTDGNWEVQEAHPSADGSRWYLVTNEGDPGSHRMWTMDADGGNRRLVIDDFGRYDPKLSPDETKVAFIYSTVETPPELYLQDVASNDIGRPLTLSTTELFLAYSWIRPEVVTINADDGATFRAHLFKPDTFGERKNRAGVVFVHGAGYLQNVADWWSPYYREYMFNQFLAANGYTVLNIDFRASKGYGRESRVAIHRHMGGRDCDDVIDAARYLMREEGIHKTKIGVYGGSYGGFLTIMSMFRYPEIISAGAAIRSVTDWAQYNHWYTSRILGTPEDDPEAFAQSSPINFAEGFEGGLLMLHGLVDPNVLAADVVRLSQVLLDLEKEDWDLVLYPLEPHGFVRASSWTNEYGRIYKHFQRELLGECE